MPERDIEPPFNADVNWASKQDRKDAERDWAMRGEIYLWRQADGTVRRVDPWTLVVRTGRADA